MSQIDIKRWLARCKQELVPRPAALEGSCRLQAVIMVGCTPNYWASSGSILSPCKVAKAT